MGLRSQDDIGPVVYGHAELQRLKEEAERYRLKYESVMRYVDAAKIVAQRYGRMCGEPLDQFIERFAKERDVPRK